MDRIWMRIYVLYVYIEVRTYMGTYIGAYRSTYIGRYIVVIK